MQKIYDGLSDSLAVLEPESIDEFLLEFIICRYFMHGASGSVPNVLKLCHHIPKLYISIETCAARVRKCVYLQGVSYKCTLEIQEYGSRIEKSDFLSLKSFFLSSIQVHTYCILKQN